MAPVDHFDDIVVEQAILALNLVLFPATASLSFESVAVVERLIVPDPLAGVLIVVETVSVIVHFNLVWRTLVVAHTDIRCEVSHKTLYSGHLD